MFPGVLLQVVRGKLISVPGGLAGSSNVPATGTFHNESALHKQGSFIRRHCTVGPQEEVCCVVPCTWERIMVPQSIAIISSIGLERQRIIQNEQ